MNNPEQKAVIVCAVVLCSCVFLGATKRHVLQTMTDSRGAGWVGHPKSESWPKAERKRSTFFHNEIAEQVVSPDATPLPQCVPTVATRTGVAKLEAISAVGESVLFPLCPSGRQGASRKARKEAEDAKAKVVATKKTLTSE